MTDKLDPNDISKWMISIPWTTRIAVKEAAERANVPLYEWINKALMLVSDDLNLLQAEEATIKYKKLQEKIVQMKVHYNKPFWERLFKKSP